MSIEEAIREAEGKYREALTDLVLQEGGGGFKRVRHQRQAFRAAIMAAAPIIAAQTLRNAAGYIESGIKAGADDPIAPAETARWLRARADLFRIDE